MTHFMGFSLPIGDRPRQQAQSINTGKEHEYFRANFTRPMRRDIRPVSVGESVDWRTMYN